MARVPERRGDRGKWSLLGTGRKPFGRIAIANSDAGANAYTDEAINQAYRAAWGELLS